MAAETKNQALDLVAAVFTRAGARLPKLRSVSTSAPKDNCPEAFESTEKAA